MTGFLSAELAGRPVFRLGLAATYRPGEGAIRRAIDEGVNYLFEFAVDTQMTSAIRSLTAAERDRIVIATGGSNFVVWQSSMRRALENALKRLRTDRIDVFHYFGILSRSHLTQRVKDELAALRSDPRVGAVAVSCHDRVFAGELAASRTVDVLMIRYNAAHRDAETLVFPHTSRAGTGVVAYTAVHWTRLLRKPNGWPDGRPVATAGQCYRFVLSNPAVHVCLMAPANERELRANIEAVRLGPLRRDEMDFLNELGDHVARQRQWFMWGT